MHIFCTGATGLVGCNFVRAAAEAGHRVVAVGGARALEPAKNVSTVRLDLLDPAQIQRAVLDAFPEIIVNCAAIASPADMDANPNIAERLNVALPEQLAQLAHHVGARLFHMSTDMVFDGTCPPYKNTDVPMPCTLYGTTKLMAEKKILKICAPQSVVLRLSHVSGNSLTTRRSLHEKLLRAWASGEKSRVRTDEIKCPLSVERLSDLLVELCERPNISGIYHFAGLEPLSRYDMAVRIAEHFGLDPREFVEPTTGERPMDLRLDISCIAARVKTRSCMFSETLEEMKLPADLEEWLRQKGGKIPVKRFKIQ